MSKLQTAPTAEIVEEITKFQRKQAQFNSEGLRQTADDIGAKILAPLFSEMARRQSLNNGAADWRQWERK